MARRSDSTRPASTSCRRSSGSSPTHGLGGSTGASCGVPLALASDPPSRPAAIWCPEPTARRPARRSSAATESSPGYGCCSGQPDAPRDALVAVLGESGIGKTRLLDELVSDATREGFLVLLGRAHETERIRPFGPWLDALQDAPRAVALDGLPASGRTELAALFPDPDLATGRPPAEPSEGAARRLLEGMTALLGRLAERSPLLCVLEDLHWADEMSLRLLAFASRRLRDQPVLITVSARTEDLEESRAFGQALDELDRGPRFEAMRLAPLSKDVTLSLALALTGGRVAPAARHRLAERAWAASEGNPLRRRSDAARARRRMAPTARARRLRSRSECGSWCVDASGV